MFNSILAVLFGKHHRAERTLVITLTLFMFLFGGFAGGLIHAHRVTVERKNHTTNITANCGWSKSSTTYHVGHIWLNPSHTVAVVPLNFGSNSFQTLSANAKNYQIKITTYDRYLNSRPKAQLVLFGSTGKGAVILRNPTAFPSQVMTLVLVEHKALTNANDGQLDQNTKGGFFSVDPIKTWADRVGKKFNLTYFEINPGAVKNYRTFNKDMSTKQVDLRYIYNQIWGKDELAKVEKNQQSLKQKIILHERRIQNYELIIKQNGYKLPDDPPYLKDNWRPQSMVDPKTGKQNSQTDNANSNLPDTLQRTDGKGTLDNDVSNQTNQANSSNSPAQQAQNAWQNLQQEWGDIYQDKLDIYVRDNAKIFNIRRQIEQQKSDATVSLLKNSHLNAPVKIKH